MNINDLFPLFAALVGFPALVAVGVNIAKKAGWLNDGSAPTVVFWVNIAGFIGVGVLYFTGNLPLLNQIDAQLGLTAEFLLTLGAFVFQLGAAKVAHASLRGAPGIGKSFSKDTSTSSG